ECAAAFEVNSINGFGGRVEKQSEFLLALVQCFLCPLAFGNIDTDPVVTNKRALLIKSRRPNVENRPIVSVVPSKPKLHSELLTTIKGLRVRVHASLQILGVDPFHPSVPEFGVHRSPCKVQPG